MEDAVNNVQTLMEVTTAAVTMLDTLSTQTTEHVLVKVNFYQI